MLGDQILHFLEFFLLFVKLVFKSLILINSEKNLNHFGFDGYNIEVGDATSFKWSKPIDAVACEGYLGKPMSQIPSDISLKEEKQECGTIVLNFLRMVI